MDKQILKTKLKHQAKNLAWRAITTIILTLTAVFTVWVYAAFVEPTAGPNVSDQDFVQNILGANNADNDFDSSLVAANKDGSILERLEYINTGFRGNECGESTTSTQTNCYVDDTARYITTDLCNEAKENSCFISTDNGYYAFGAECADSTTTAKTNCYIDDTAKYADSDACSAASNSGYCFINTATFSAMDSDLAAGNIKNGVTIFGVNGTYASAQSNPTYPDLFHMAAFIEPSAGPADYDQDFPQNILGANNADNDFDSSLVASSSTGSIIERLESVIYGLENGVRWFETECGESTTSTQTNCYVDDTARYLTTDLCNEAKENSCFVPTDNGYYAFGTECSDSTTSTQTNCYVDDTARYIDSNICSVSSDTGYCYMNTANFSDMDADLVAGNIKYGVVIFGVSGTYPLANGESCSSAEMCSSGYCADSVCCNNSCSGSTCQTCGTYSSAGIGNCGYVNNASQDPRSECPGAFGTCAATTCSGTGNSCGYATGQQGCATCNYCTGGSYSCTAATNNWGIGAYSCTNSNQRCYSGSCITCGGWMNAGYCWYNGGSNQDCTTVCSSRGGVYGGTCDWVNDPTDCSTCLHYFEGVECWGAPGQSQGPDSFVYISTRVCTYHLDGANQCGLIRSAYRQCACEQ